MNSLERKLCDDIFQKHPQAIQKILLNNLSPKIEFALLKALITLAKNNEFSIDETRTTYISFTNKIITWPFYLEFYNGGIENGTSLSLYIWVPSDKKRVQKKFTLFANKHANVFKGDRGGKHWPRFYRKEIVPALSSQNEADRISTIVEKWQEFLETDLPKIEKKIQLFHNEQLKSAKK